MAAKRSLLCPAFLCSLSLPPPFLLGRSVSASPFVDASHLKSFRLTRAFVMGSCIHSSEAKAERTNDTNLKMSNILDSPSAQRNKEPIWEVLSTRVFPDLVRHAGDEGRIRVLEVAAGVGVHTLHFVSSYFDDKSFSQCRAVEWFPTDPHDLSRQSIDARVASLPHDSLVCSAIRKSSPLKLGKTGGVYCRGGYSENVGGGNLETASASSSDAVFDIDDLDLMICINMIHIAPWDATLGLMLHAKKALRPGGLLYCYGPYKVGDATVESNLRFDQALRQQDPSWGVRELGDVVEAAKDAGLELVEKVEMPANNLSLLFRKLM